MSQRGEAVYLFTNQSYIPGGQTSVDSSDTVQMGQNNAVTVFAFVAGSGVSVDVTVLGAALNGGFLPLPDPNATQKAISASQTFDCLVGSDNVKVRLANLSGSFQNGQGVTILVQPYQSPGVRQRPNYYDRNPSTVAQTASVIAAAPHSATVRWSYTVPTGRKAFIEAGWGYVIRAGAATAAQEAQCALQYTPSGGSQQEMSRAEITTNNVLDKDKLVLATLSTMLEGDSAQAVTQDLSTGGTVSYVISIKGIEFDQ